MKTVFKLMIFLSVLMLIFNCAEDEYPDDYECTDVICEVNEVCICGTCYDRSELDTMESISLLTGPGFYRCNSIFNRNRLGNLSNLPVFNVESSKIIQIPPYEYIRDSTLYYSIGDSIIQLAEQFEEGDNCCGKNLKQIDRFPVAPTFEWQVNNENEFVAVAIFEKPVQLSQDGKSISNVEDIIWTWNSGMGNGIQQSGKLIIQYNDGKNVEEGKILSSSPTPLSGGKLYTWVIWGWNESGTQVLFSSRKLPFWVEQENIEPLGMSDPQLLHGVWVVTRVVDQFNGMDITDVFPIKRIQFVNKSRTTYIEQAELCDGPLNVQIEEILDYYINSDTLSSTYLANENNSITLENELTISSLNELEFACRDEFTATSIYNNSKIVLTFKKLE